jgi:HK97 family phage major capsid protein
MFVELLKDFLGHRAGERIAVDDKDRESLIASGVAKAFSDDPITPLVAKGIESALGGFTKGLDGIIQATLKQFADAQSKSKKNGVPILFGEHNTGNPRHSFGDWILGVARNDRAYVEKHYGSTFNEWQTKAALGEASGVTGGYTVPVEYYQQMQALMAEQTFIRPRAFVVPMHSATMYLPYMDITTAQSAGTTPFFGGINMSWTAEAATRSETEPTFRNIELKAWELSGYTLSSNVLLQDSIVSLEKFLMQLFAQALGWYEEYAFLQGNGVGKPLGMLSAPATITVTRQSANQVQFQDISKMWGSLLPASWSRAIWLFTPTVVQQLLQLKDGANRTIFLSIDQGVTKTPVWALMGRPAIATEKLPALGTPGDIMLIDPSLYVIGDRMQMDISASEHVNFLKNQMTWRVVERVDGQPWLSGPVTLQDGATQVSPFVKLST